MRKVHNYLFLWYILILDPGLISPLNSVEIAITALCSELLLYIISPVVPGVGTGVGTGVGN